MGDTYTLSGDFRGSMININATLTNVTQTISTLPGTDAETRKTLEKLVAELQAALEKVPPDKALMAEAIALQAKQLTDAANMENPNPAWLQVTADGLKSAAKAIADVVPTALSVAIQIADTITRIGM
jgi:hypothetical protein